MRGHEAEIMELQALMEVWRGEMACIQCHYQINMRFRRARNARGRTPTRMGARMLYDWIRRLLQLVVVRDERRFLLGRIISIRMGSTEILIVIIGYMLLLLLLLLWLMLVLLLLLIHRLRVVDGSWMSNEKWEIVNKREQKAGTGRRRNRRS